MPPSRGPPLRAIRFIAHLRPPSVRYGALSSRLYSTRPIALTSPRISQSWRGSIANDNLHLLNAKISLPAILSFRRNQSTSTSASSSSIPTVPSPAESSLSSNAAIEGLQDIHQTPDYSSIPEQIGFMQQLGLEWAWYSPSLPIQWVLEHVYIYTGLPWWASIMITAVGIRIAILPVALKQSDMMARMTAFTPVLKPLNEKMTAARMSGDSFEMAKVQQEVRAAQKSVGIKTRWMWLPILVQIPLGIGAFRLMRYGAQLPVPSWEFGGFGWITDLTVPDPYYILPIGMALTMHIVARMGEETGVKNRMSAIMKPMLYYVLPATFLLFTYWQPVALQLSFFVTLLYGAGQGLLLRNPRFRKWAGMYPLISRAQLQMKPGQMQRQQAAQMPSSLNLARTSYQAPTLTPKQEKKGVFAGAKNWYEEAKKEAVKYQNQKGKGDAGKRPREFIKSAEAYEQRRKKELDAEKLWRKKAGS